MTNDVEKLQEVVETLLEYLRQLMGNSDFEESPFVQSVLSYLEDE